MTKSIAKQFKMDFGIVTMKELNSYEDNIKQYNKEFLYNPKVVAEVEHRKTFKKAPAKTALNILISTAVLISQYVDIPEFNNLTYKDELELDRLGEEKMVLFLNIPLADRTYSWITVRLWKCMEKRGPILLLAIVILRFFSVVRILIP